MSKETEWGIQEDYWKKTKGKRFTIMKQLVKTNRQKVTIHSLCQPNNINLQKYKSILLDKLEDTLEITDFDIIKIRSEMLNETANINPIDKK